ncbi:MAG: 2-dehydropantoate 2-reductase [Paraglaciecola sp.]|uniref:ketopantoate reductase family protein n=1 Tax=Paraglaciecola sp. TaxID=1920173 RepID=UPI00329698A8
MAKVCNERLKLIVITATLKIAILGKGAIGSLIAYSCHQQKLDYQLLLKTSKAITLDIETINGEKTLINPHTSDIKSASDFDVVVLPIKAYQVLGALQQLIKIITPKHTLVLLHNGMGTIEQVKALYPNNPIIAGTTSYGAYKPTETSVKATGLGETHLGWITKPDDNASLIESTVSKLLPPSTWHQDIRLALWNKLTINSVINPLTAINDIKNGELADKKYQQDFQAICSEVAQVMNAVGYTTSSEALQQKVMKVIKATANNYSSMHQDISFKRKSEIEFINGYVVKKSQELNISTPKNQRLVAKIKELEG